MHERFENQYLNRTTAEAAVRMLERLDTGGLLPAERRKLVEEAMIASRTGSRRIRSVLPGDVVAGDKTGSSLRSAEGMTAADNDLAFVRLPDGTTYYMAVLVANSFEDDRPSRFRRTILRKPITYRTVSDGRTGRQQRDGRHRPETAYPAIQSAARSAQRSPSIAAETMPPA